MHILITDSGVGGLSVCAYAERLVRTRGCPWPTRLTFANAAPANDYGYNSMPSREEKVATFERFLRSAASRFEPDLIYVACNTLSVLLPDTAFARGGSVPVQGIVETGIETILTAIQDEEEWAAIIFATPTTIGAGTYARLLQERGLPASHIVSQACPVLADTISEDRQGSKTRAEIQQWVDVAIERLPRNDLPVVACLACTHYGYRRDLFSEALAQKGMRARVVDPNERAAADLLKRPGPHRQAEVQVVSRYRIPETALSALTFFLGDISPSTVAALKSFEHAPDLF